MSSRLTGEQLDRFERDGIVFPLDALSAGEVARFRRNCDALEDQLGGRPKPVLLNQTHLHFPWAFALASHEAVLDAVAQVLGPDVLIWATSIFPKHPRDPAYISWHQDARYWGMDSGKIVTAWIALSHSMPENGCMRVVPGSHRRSLLPHVDRFGEHNLLSRGQEIAAEVDESEALDVVLRPGEMSLHHVQIIHGSNPNRSDEKRVGFAVRFVTPEVRQTGQRPQAVLARGVDRCGHFDLVDPPAERDPAEALAAHQESARQLLATVMK